MSANTIAGMHAFWATPDMTLAHLLMATGLTAYILVAIPYEERDLEEFHGTPYTEYRKRTPMFVPRVMGGISRRPRVEAEETKSA